jgi:hypothetical protein
LPQISIRCICSDSALPAGYSLSAESETAVFFPSYSFVRQSGQRHETNIWPP